MNLLKGYKLASWGIFISLLNTLRLPSPYHLKQIYEYSFYCIIELFYISLKNSRNPRLRDSEILTFFFLAYSFMNILYLIKKNMNANINKTNS